MSSEIVMPQLGLTMTEGSVTTWLKRPGESVAKGEPLFTVETDKVEMEVESTARGYLTSILVDVGKVVKVGTVIALISESISESRDGPVAPPQAVASPRARKLAKELGVDIQKIKPSRGHRIVEEDVRQYHQEHADAPVIAELRPTARKIVAQRLTASFQQAPHFYLGVEVNASELVRLRERLVEKLKVTYTDFFLMALARSLREQEPVNSRWQNDTVTRNLSVDIGFAVQGAEALLVPVIRHADHLSLPEMSHQRQMLSEKARAGKLSLPEMEGGSATLSNLGQYGIDWFQAILNPPQSVIVSTGRIAKRPAVLNDRLEVCDCLSVTVSADHRVLDGVAAARFLSRIKELLENPYVFLV